MNPVTIAFQLTEDEYLNAWKVRHRVVGIRYLTDVTIAIFLFVGGLVTAKYYGANGLNLTAIFVSVAFLTILFSATLRGRVYYRNDPKFRAEQKMAFSEQGISYQTQDASSTLDWTFYSSVIETKELILLLYSKNQHSIIPKRAFNSPQDIENFRDIAIAAGLKIHC